MADRDLHRARTDVSPDVDPDVATERVIDLAGLERRRDRQAADRGWSTDAAHADRPDADRPDAPDARRPGRRAAVVAVVAVLLLAVMSVVAVVGHQRGTAWRATALEQQARADGLRDQVVAADADVRAAAEAVAAAESTREAAVTRQEAASGQLEGSEDDVAALEARIAALAGEKARLEDELVIAGEAVRASSVDGGAVRRCIEELDGWLAAAPQSADGTAWQVWAGRSPVNAPVCDALR